MDKNEFCIEDSERKIEDMVDFLCKALAKLLAKTGFEIAIEMANVAKARVFFDYFVILVHNMN